jgi:RNA polymerase sigma-70 factor, ECF subfamily
LDASTFDTRLKSCTGRLYGYAVALTRNPELAADLCQDCMVRVMGRTDAPREERAFRSWLFRIMRNLWIDEVRARGRRTELEAAIELSEAATPSEALERMIVNRIAVHQAFARLGDDHRDVLALVDIAGFSYQEAADLLCIPRGTVMSRVSRARASLCALLSDDDVAVFPASIGTTRDG